MIKARNDWGDCTFTDQYEHATIANLRQSIPHQPDAAADFNEALSWQLDNTRERLAAAPMNATVEQLATEVLAS